MNKITELWRGLHQEPKEEEWKLSRVFRWVVSYLQKGETATMDDGWVDWWEDKALRAEQLETANADLLEALENLSGAVHAVGYDTTSIVHPSLLNANEAIRKHKGEDDISDLVAGLEHAADLCDAIQERKAKENER